MPAPIELSSIEKAAVLCRELGLDLILFLEDLEKLPVLWNMPFGHTSPICVIPYGTLAEIDCDNAGFSILGSGCL
jgi:muramoyltetrapeptide carboxypeptidase LdcA involved in peptidoglycan recycling